MTARPNKSYPHNAATGGSTNPSRYTSPCGRSRASSSGPSRSTQSAPCASRIAGAMASDVADHAADHDLEARRARRCRMRQRLGQAAGLVELDVDGVVAAARARRGRRGVWQLSSAQTGTARGMPAERVVTAGRQRLLDQLDAELGRRRPAASAQLVRLSRPSLASAIEARVGRALRAPRACGRHRRPPPSLILSSGWSACAARLRGHGRRRVEAQRVGGDTGGGAARPASSPDALGRCASPRDPTARSRARCAPRPAGRSLKRVRRGSQLCASAPSIAAATPSTVSP